MLVESIMVKQVITVTPETYLLEALALTQKHRIRHLPVVGDGRLVGLISDRDLRDAAPSTLELEERKNLLAVTPVERVMHQDVITCHPLDFVEEAALQIYKHRIGCLPVVSQGQIVGILSAQDILRTLVEMMGVHTPSSRVEVDVPDRPGMLAECCDFLRARRINTTAVMVFPSVRPGFKRIVFRIGTMDPRRFIQDLEAAGYQVVPPAADVWSADRLSADVSPDEV